MELIEGMQASWDVFCPEVVGEGVFGPSVEEELAPVPISASTSSTSGAAKQFLIQQVITDR